MLRSLASVRAATPGIAKQIVVVLALCDPEHFYVYTDSRDAIRAFEMGNLAREMFSILKKRACLGFRYIIWFPAHMGRTFLRASQTSMNWLTSVRKNPRATAVWRLRRGRKRLSRTTHFSHSMKLLNITNLVAECTLFLIRISARSVSHSLNVADGFFPVPGLPQ